jgi:TonB family protein
MTVHAPSLPRFPARPDGVRLLACGAALAMLCMPALARQDEGSGAAAQSVPGAKPTMPTADFGSCAKPDYPKESLRQGQQGAVTLSFLIGADGTVKGTNILKSSGFPLLDMAAQDGIGRCKFRPGRVDGQAVQAWMRMQYVWTLDGLSPAQAAAELAAARAGAERGDPAYQYKLGTIKLSRDGLDYNPRDGVAWLRKSADLGYTPAQLALAMALQHGLAGPADTDEAMAWYRKAAEIGSAQGQHGLAVLLWQRGGSADIDAAHDWLRKATASGYLDSAVFHGTLLMQETSPASIAQGLALVRTAAARNHAGGLLSLARAYASGHGVARDEVEAAALYEKAALNGSKPAQRQLAELYERGVGVAADPAKAARWREIAGVAQGAQP